MAGNQKMMLTMMLFSLAMVCALTSAQRQPQPVVEAEENVYTYDPPDNGAGPMWCYGSSCITRIGDDVFVSGLETLKGVQPLNNVRWLLFERPLGRLGVVSKVEPQPHGWELQQADEGGRTREPCPLASFPDGSVFLSVNPTLTELDVRPGPARPQVLQFSSDPKAAYQTLLPVWDDSPAFTEHSYRGLAADGPNRELLLLNILGHEAQYWSFLDKEGRWSARGKLVFPMGHDYEVPEPIRLCYPNVALRNRAAHVLAISDIVEPVQAWREFKLQLTGQTWDYDFRRLFYTWTPDITSIPFADWVEIASREKTAGHISNLDLWVGPDGAAHLLWLETSLDTRLREKFFPQEPLTVSLEYCVVRGGHVASRQTLVKWEEGVPSDAPRWGRFHATDEGRLFVFYACETKDAQGNPLLENRLLEIYPQGGFSEPVKVLLKHPFGPGFMTATWRNGTLPSKTLDVLGECPDKPRTIRYARIRLW